MAKFRKKPVVIEATQWFPGVEIPGLEYSPLSTLPFIKTLEGDMYVNPSDWIITGVMGEKYPCRVDIFEKTYEPVEE